MVAWFGPAPTEARDAPFKSASWWLDLKRSADGVPADLWRVHDSLYDLRPFLKRHPGGKAWIEMTRGTDATELFESYHLDPKVRVVLDKYFVRKCLSRSDVQRPSRMTFADDGFYKVLKGRVWNALQESGSGVACSARILRLSDALLAAYLAVFAAAAATGSLKLAAAAGLLLGLVCGFAHNFFHQRDNWRMYMFDLSPLSSWEWRVSHCYRFEHTHETDSQRMLQPTALTRASAYSHHMFPNQSHDAEVLGVEPFYVFLPGKEVGYLRAAASVVYAHAVNTCIFHFMLLLRVIAVATRKQDLRPENALPLLQLAAACLLAPTPSAGVWVWHTCQAAASLWFITTSLVAGTHHHPDLWHDGQEATHGTDFGACQLAAVMEREDVNATLLGSASMFGEHALHHLFPALDHSRLRELRPLLERTCEEYGLAGLLRSSSTAGCAAGFFSNIAACAERSRRAASSQRRRGGQAVAQPHGTQDVQEEDPKMK
jgi:hypothetical protein